VALAAGISAGFAGSYSPVLADDEISALDLAQRIKARQPDLQLLDLRGQAEFEADRLPGARSIAQPTGSLSDTGKTWVVYSARDTQAGVLASLLTGPKQSNILRLRGGYEAWSTEVLFPTLRDDAADAQRRAFEQRAQLSRYFGGSPRVRVPGATADLPRSRRGC
jgi:rhodanese-related sulfurtransferase